MIKLPFKNMKNKSNYGREKTKSTGFLSKLRALFFNTCSLLGEFFVFCKDCIWNIFWAFIGVLAALVSLSMIFLFGLSTVLLVMRYPVIGLEILIIGIGLICAAIMIFAFSLIKRKKKECISEEKSLEDELMEVVQNA